MRAEAEMAMKSLRGRMYGFLQVGLLDDECLYARELRRLRTEITRTIVELEKRDGVPGALVPVETVAAVLDLEKRDGIGADSGSRDMASGGAPVAAVVDEQRSPDPVAGPGTAEGT